MKGTISITLSTEILSRIDQLAGSKHSRFAFIEGVVRRYLRERRRARIHAHDIQRINSAADQLNSEVADVLEYQASED
jgi:metal-responsive CopG/Arc/MetJ family transcriptional regulator